MRKLITILFLFATHFAHAQMWVVTQRITSYDSSATAFSNAAGLTDQMQRLAAWDIATGYKNILMWNLSDAIYPVIGGTAATHKWNLKDVRDVDAAFRIAYFGTWIHSATGAKPNGTDAYGNTFYNPSVSMTIHNTRIGYLSNTDAPGALEKEIGSGDAGNYISLSLKRSDNTIKSDAYNDVVGAGRLSAANTNSTGWYVSSKISEFVHALFKNGSSLASTSTAGGSLPNKQIYVGAIFGAAAETFSTKEMQGAVIGKASSFDNAPLEYNIWARSKIYLNR